MDLSRSFIRLRKTGILVQDRLRRPGAIVDGFDRIYHVHVRKTGGTSINQSFMAHLDAENVDSNSRRLIRDPLHRVNIRGRAVVGYDKFLLQHSSYFFGFSHIPLWNLELPDSAFVLTCFRDPLRRLLSHYNMLLAFREAGRASHLEHEQRWLGNGFADFLDRIPKEHLLCQLYMFDPDMDVQKALLRLRRCNAVLTTENLQRDLEVLGHRLGLTLPLLHARKGSVRSELAENEREKALQLLEPEYAFLEQALDAAYQA